MLYATLKYIHIVLAIVAVGFNLSYAIWLVRAARTGNAQLSFALHGIKFLDSWFANPAYVLLVLTGVAMAIAADLPLTTFWLLVPLVLVGVIALIGLGVYSPTLRRQLALVEAGQTGGPEYRRVALRGNVLGSALIVLVLIIIGLMVFKPTLG